MSEGLEEACLAENGLVLGQNVNKSPSPSVSDSSDGGEEEIDENAAVNMTRTAFYFIFTRGARGNF